MLALIGSETANKPEQLPFTRQIHDARALLPLRFAGLRQRGHIDAFLLHQQRIAQRQPLSFDHTANTDAGGRIKVLQLGERETLLARRVDNGRRKRMLAALIEARRQTQHVVFVRFPLRQTAESKAGLPSVSVPVLSTIIVSRRLKFSMADASRNRMPCVAALPVATMIDMGVARPSAQGHAMISTATALMSPNCQPCSPPKQSPRDRTARARSVTTVTTK